jgi:hypothetical protein
MLVTRGQGLVGLLSWKRSRADPRDTVVEHAQDVAAGEVAAGVASPTGFDEAQQGFVRLRRFQLKVAFVQHGPGRGWGGGCMFIHIRLYKATRLQCSYGRVKQFSLSRVKSRFQITSPGTESRFSTRLESLKGKRCCREVKFYSGVSPLTSRWSCLSRILSEAAEPRCSTPIAIKLPDTPRRSEAPPR